MVLSLLKGRSWGQEYATAAAFVHSMKDESGTNPAFKLSKEASWALSKSTCCRLVHSIEWCKNIFLLCFALSAAFSLVSSGAVLCFFCCLYYALCSAAH